MRLGYAVLFVVTVLVASVTASSEPTEPMMKKSNIQFLRDLTDDLRDMRAPRSLRAEKSTKTKDGIEERASSWLKKLIKLFTAKVVTKKSAAMELANSKKSADEVFKVLNLDTLGPHLFERDALPKFFKFNELRGQNLNGVSTFLQHYTDVEVMMTVNYGLQQTDELTFNIAKELRDGLISKWLSEKKPAIEVAQLLKGKEKTMAAFNRGEYSLYMDKINKINKEITNTAA